MPLRIRAGRLQELEDKVQQHLIVAGVQIGDNCGYVLFLGHGRHILSYCIESTLSYLMALYRPFRIGSIIIVCGVHVSYDIETEGVLSRPFCSARRAIL